MSWARRGGGPPGAAGSPGWDHTQPPPRGGTAGPLAGRTPGRAMAAQLCHKRSHGCRDVAPVARLRQSPARQRAGGRLRSERTEARGCHLGRRAGCLHQLQEAPPLVWPRGPDADERPCWCRHQEDAAERTGRSQGTAGGSRAQARTSAVSAPLGPELHSVAARPAGRQQPHQTTVSEHHGSRNTTTTGDPGGHAWDRPPPPPPPCRAGGPSCCCRKHTCYL